MRNTRRSNGVMLGLAAAAWVWSGSAAGAPAGAPATPVSYAGVARRSTVGVGAAGVGAAPGVGAPGVGAAGVGAAPGVGVPGVAGVGVGAPGAGAAPANRGGPVNRVGVH